MSTLQLVDDVNLRPAKWVKLELFCKMTGHTRESIKSIKNKGAWIEGVHYKMGPEGRVFYFNWEAIDNLITKHKHKHNGKI